MSPPPVPLPDDLLVTAADEVRIRQDLVLTALGRRPADRALRVGRLLDVHTRTWLTDHEIVIKGRRIAWIGPAGAYPGEVAERVARPGLAALPGFGEVHKHIESSHLTPEWEAALVLPRGNTWTCEASHEFSNVAGPHNLAFWLEARRRGSPLKIFPQPGSAVPPTAYEWGGGWYGRDEQAAHLAGSLMVTGLDEVMDWPAVWNPENPSHARLWGMIEATFAGRGVVEGHGAGLRDLPSINAFAAAGLASDHEVQTPEEVWDKLARGLFVELRIPAIPEVVPALLARGLADWSQVALTTDDRSASRTLATGASDYNARLAIAHGLPPEIAVQCLTINPARHMRLTPWVGSLAPGRLADVVLVSDLDALAIAEVWADGQPVSEGPRYAGFVPAIAWPDRATDTVNIRRTLGADDFVLAAEAGRMTMQAAVIRPYHWHPDFDVIELPVQDGAVQRDPERAITKFAIVDRFSGEGRVSKMFWRGCGPKNPGTALACSVAHDKHNIWVVGSCDAAMAQAANAVVANRGGWALVREGTLAATQHGLALEPQGTPAMARMTLQEALTRSSTIDSARLDATTEADIRRYQVEDGFDPDADPTEVVEVLPPREVRRRLGLSQAAFARALRIPAATLRNWEQGRTTLDPAVQTLFRIVGREPVAAMRALGVTLTPSRTEGRAAGRHR